MLASFRGMHTAQKLASMLPTLLNPKASEPAIAKLFPSFCSLSPLLSRPSSSIFSAPNWPFHFRRNRDSDPQKPSQFNFSRERERERCHRNMNRNLPSILSPFINNASSVAKSQKSIMLNALFHRCSDLLILWIFSQGNRFTLSMNWILFLWSLVPVSLSSPRTLMESIILHYSQFISLSNAWDDSHFQKSEVLIINSNKIFITPTPSSHQSVEDGEGWWFS